MTLEIPSIPHDSAVAYLLSGEHGKGAFVVESSAAVPRFRETPILAQVELHAAQISDVIQFLRSPEIYDGKVMRCFIPRHGLRFSAHRQILDVLFCFECHWVYFFVGGKQVMHPLSRVAIEWLHSFYRSVFPQFLEVDHTQIANRALKKGPIKIPEPTPSGVAHR